MKGRLTLLGGLFLLRGFVCSYWVVGCVSVWLRGRVSRGIFTPLGEY